MLNSGCIEPKQFSAYLNLVPLYKTKSVMWCYALCNHLHVQSYECRRLGDRLREHLRDLQRNEKDASKPVSKHFPLPTYSMQHTAVSGLSLNLSTSESRKTLEQKFIFQIGTLIYIYKYTQTNKCQN